MRQLVTVSRTMTVSQLALFAVVAEMADRAPEASGGWVHSPRRAALVEMERLGHDLSLSNVDHGLGRLVDYEWLERKASGCRTAGRPKADYRATPFGTQQARKLLLHWTGQLLPGSAHLV